MTSGLLQPPDGWLWRRLTGLCPGKSRENIDCKVNNVLSICLDLPWPMFSFLHHSFNNIPMFPFKGNLAHNFIDLFFLCLSSQ